MEIKSFQQKIIQWAQHVIAAQDHHKKDAEHGIISAYDTGRMLKEVDNIIAEGFGCDPIFDE